MMEWLKGRKVSKRTALIIFVLVWQLTTIFLKGI